MMTRFVSRTALLLTIAALALLALLAGSGALAQESGGIIVPPPPPAGDIVFASNRFGNYEIFTMTVSGSGQARRTTAAGDDTLPVWSPDGTKIAFVSDRDGNDQIYVMNANGSSQTNVSNNIADDSYPSWSPDGSKIAFSTNRDGDFQVYVMDADGGAPANLSNGPNDDHAPSWSPNGQKIAFLRDDAIWTMNANGGSQTELESFPSTVISRLVWKPDGSRIATSRYANENVWAIDADGSNLKPLFAGVYPAWSPAGDRMVFSRGAEIRTADEDGGDQVQLTNNDDIDVHPHWKGVAGNGGLVGDVNCDGSVDAIDAALVLQLGAGFLQSLECQENADVNEDGSIDSVDAALILQYAAGLLDSLPP